MKKTIIKNYQERIHHYSFKLIYILALSSMSHTVIAQTTTFKIATWLPKTHVMNRSVLKEWASWIEKDTNGRVNIILEHPETHPKNMLDLVKSEKYDGSWIYHGFWPEKFKSTQLIELPLNGVGPEAASVAHWRIHNKHFRQQNEYEGMRLIATFTHGESQLHSKEPIINLDQLKGKKVRVSGSTGAQAEVAKRLGLTSVTASPLQVYDLLKNDEISIAFMPMVEKKALKLKEVAPYTYKFRGGLYLGSFGVFLNPKSLEKLSEKDRAIVMSNSGEKLSRFAGISWNKEDIEGEKDAVSYGNSITNATPTMRDDFEKLMLDVDNIWVETIKAIGLDGEKILEEYRMLSRCGSITAKI